MGHESITNCWKDRRDSNWIRVQPLSWPRSKWRGILEHNLRKTTLISVMLNMKSYSWMQWNFLGQTAASRCEIFPKFRESPPSPSSGCAGVLVAPKLTTAHLKMGTELVPETSKNLHILTQLSARENIIEFCRRESFKTCILEYIKTT
jgi:hypothetical protein